MGIYKLQYPAACGGDPLFSLVLPSTICVSYDALWRAARLTSVVQDRFQRGRNRACGAPADHVRLDPRIATPTRVSSLGPTSVVKSARRAARHPRPRCTRTGRATPLGTARDGLEQGECA